MPNLLIFLPLINRSETCAAFLWARELVFTRSKLLVFTISREVSLQQKYGVKWRK